ncbi:MAG: DUF2141 domain-containing protein [Robiginitalea sp.]|jgi:uncharacterized protein (DUF2141 family)
MKPLLYLILTVSALLAAPVCQSTGVTVTVTLENVLSDRGDILAVLHTAETFMKDEGLDSFKTEARKGAITFAFENVAPGTYAISVLQDLNGNRRMDYELNGKPKEPYGMSGNDMSIGPPTFERVKFKVGMEDLHLRIRF